MTGTPGPGLPAGASVRLARLEVHVFRVAIRRPVVTSFGTIPSRASALIRIEDADGAAGWGEIWGNFPTITTEYRAELAGFVLPPLVLGRPIADPAAFRDELARKLHVLSVQGAEHGPMAAVAAAFDQALWDLLARRAGQPLRRLLNPDAPDRVPAYASGLNPGEAAEQVTAARAAGFRAFKLKIGFGDETDFGNIGRIRAGMGPGERLLTDANQAWGLDEAVRMANALAEHGIGWLEEPMVADAPAEAWRRLKAASPVPVAGGENLRGRPAFREAFAWLDVVQPDVGKWGGITGCLRIARAALAAGRSYCPHWLGGGVGLLHSAQLLAAAGGPGLLETDVNENPLREALVAGALAIADGDAVLPPGPGLGIDPPLGELARFRVAHREYR